MASGEVNIRISATDQASAKLSQIESRLDSMGGKMSSAFNVAKIGAAVFVLQQVVGVVTKDRKSVV